MAQYVDGFVLPVPRDRLDEYKRVAEAAAEVWKEHGALDYWECVNGGFDRSIESNFSFEADGVRRVPVAHPCQLPARLS